MAFPFSTTALPVQHFINNEYVDGLSTDPTLTVHNPVDGSIVSSSVPIAGSVLVDRAVASAEAAFPSWRQTSPADRQTLMMKLADLLDSHTDDLASLTRLTLGAPKSTFGRFEVKVCANAFRYYAGWIDKFVGESLPDNNGFVTITRHEPIGVTAGIVPWNGPLGSLGLKVAPALATGNTFILKPSEKTPFAALALGSLFIQAGFPPGVFQVLAGDGSTGSLLAQHMRIRKISFTGSVPVGRLVQAAAAQSNLKRVTLELGGKSPAIVFADANLDVAVPWLERAITSNTGQVCFAASRVYVERSIYKQFLTRYVAEIEAKSKLAGDPNEPETQLGPLVDKSQLDRVVGFINRAKSSNAGTLLTGGSQIGSTGNFIQPTVFADVDPAAEIHTDEIFGPVSVVCPFDSEIDVIAQANKTEFGLMAGVFTQDINRALRVAAQFESGMVGVNCVSLMFDNAPFGGAKQSGLGREGGIDALRAFTETKTVMINLGK